MTSTSTGWWVMVDDLPPESAVRDYLRTNDLPDSVEDLWTDNNLRQAFGLWAQHSQSLGVSDDLPAMNAVIIYAKQKWNIQADGTLGTPATAAQVREVNASWFSNSYRLTTNVGQRLREKGFDLGLNDIVDDRDAYPDDSSVEVVQWAAEAIWAEAFETAQSTYDNFREDVTVYRQNIADRPEMQQFFEGLAERVHELNRRKAEALESRQETTLRVYIYAGKPLVTLGDMPRPIRASLGTKSALSTLLGKKHGLFGGSTGEWIVEDAGRFLAEIKKELNEVCASKKVVKVGPVPADYELKDELIG
jgi:hypothetical protein